MKVRITKAGAPASAQDLERLERIIGRSLPSEYMEFLRQANGCQVESNIFRVDTSNDSGVREFFSVAQILDERVGLRDRLSAGTWPIADADGGNCVCLRQDAAGGWDVIFWDHELEEETLIATSFGEFLASLEKFDPKSVELRPEQVISAWIDPDLLKEQDD